MFLNLFQLSSEDIPGSMISKADLEKCKKANYSFGLTAVDYVISQQKEELNFFLGKLLL